MAVRRAENTGRVFSHRETDIWESEDAVQTKKAGIKHGVPHLLQDFLNISALE